MSFWMVDVLISTVFALFFGLFAKYGWKPSSVHSNSPLSERSAKVEMRLP